MVPRGEKDFSNFKSRDLSALLASQRTVGEMGHITPHALGPTEGVSWTETRSTEPLLFISALLGRWQKDQFPHQEFS